MQPAISIGTLLQNRYRIVQLLGQGGFGRTYLAEDEGRFKERCAIKEFVPIQGEDKFSDKATQLFQREASVLYQITHPQIPQFRATFEEEERLFLVQDYVEGPTYHQVMMQRQSQGRTFSETEIRQFLQQVLPVLAHIHAKGIIHRDVSPDNIILRQRDSRPVLIDFGVVKEVVTRLHADGETPATTVGKAGYAPSEQMQTGRAYPSSDLYALAVTAIALLTGKEPQTLFDDVNAVWRWRDSVQVSEPLANVLDKALSYRPGDRFQSVSEMAQALQTGNIQPSDRAGSVLNQPGSNQPSSNRPGSPKEPPRYATPPLSQMKTVAVGRSNPEAQMGNAEGSTARRPQTVKQDGNGRDRAQSRSLVRSTYTPSQPQKSSLLENPLAVVGLAIGLALLAGLGGYAIVKTLDTSVAPEPTITSLPPLGSETPTLAPTPTPTQSTPQPVEYNLPELALSLGTTKTLKGSMRSGDTVNHPLVAEAGQRLSVEQFEDGVRLSVLDSNGNPVERSADRVVKWSGTLEESGRYTVRLTPERGVKSSNYRLDVTLSAAPRPVPTPSITPTPEPLPLPDPDPTPEPRPDPRPDPRPAPSPEEPEDRGRNGDEEVESGEIPNSSDTPLEPEQDSTDPTPVEPDIQPDVRSQRIDVPNGSRTSVSGQVGRGRISQYRLDAQEGQFLSIEIASSPGAATFNLISPADSIITNPDAQPLPFGGIYTVEVAAQQPSTFTLHIAKTSQPLSD